MAMFKIVAATQLKMVVMVFLLGSSSSFRAAPESPDNACGWDLYSRVVLAHYSLVLIAVSAAMGLFMVCSGLRIAEAAAARAAEDYADREGIFSVAPGLWLRGELLVAVFLSFAASVLAVVAILDGSLYRTGCHAGVAGHGSGSLLGVLLVCLFALVHGFFAWAAVTQD